MYWLLARGIRAVREDCCDDLVVAAGLSPRATYCQTLLNAAQVAAGRVMAGASFACPRESRRLRRRLRRIMNNNFRPVARLSMKHIALVAVFGLVLLPGVAPRASGRSLPESGENEAGLPIPAFYQQAGASSDCLTPSGTPCFTIQYHRAQWEFFSAGITDVRRYSSDITEAVRRDGTGVSRTVDAESYQFLKGSTRTDRPLTVMYLPYGNQVIRYQSSPSRMPRLPSFLLLRQPPVTWFRLTTRRSSEGDSTCSTAIRHFGADFKYAGEATVAGVSVSKWTRGSWWGSQEEELYLAPSLDCECLKSYKVYRNRWLLPRLTDSKEAISVKLGDPDPALFAVPPGSLQVDPRLWLVRR